MKDNRGLYYYPYPGNKQIRMYVDRSEGEIRFRMWNQDDPTMWDQHGWQPYGAIVQAAAIYTGSQFDPNQAYDIDIAKALLKQNDN